MRTLATIVEHRLLLFLPIGQVLKHLWHFEILTWESMGKPKMWLISKTVIIEWNGRKFGTQGTTVHILKVLLVPDSLSLVWGHSVHFAKFPILRFLTLPLSQFSSAPLPIFIWFLQKLCKVSWSYRLSFLSICQKIAKIMAFWNFSYHRTICRHNFQSAISPTIFIGAHPNFMTTLVTMVI